MDETTFSMQQASTQRLYRHGRKASHVSHEPLLRPSSRAMGRQTPTEPTMSSVYDTALESPLPDDAGAAAPMLRNRSRPTTTIFRRSQGQRDTLTGESLHAIEEREAADAQTGTTAAGPLVRAHPVRDRPANPPGLSAEYLTRYQIAQGKAVLTPSMIAQQMESAARMRDAEGGGLRRRARSATRVQRAPRSWDMGLKPCKRENDVAERRQSVVHAMQRLFGERA